MREGEKERGGRKRRELLRVEREGEFLFENVLR